MLGATGQRPVERLTYANDTSTVIALMIAVSGGTAIRRIASDHRQADCQGNDHQRPTSKSALAAGEHLQEGTDPGGPAGRPLRKVLPGPPGRRQRHRLRGPGAQRQREPAVQRDVERGLHLGLVAVGRDLLHPISDGREHQHSAGDLRTGSNEDRPMQTRWPTASAVGPGMRSPTSPAGPGIETRAVSFIIAVPVAGHAGLGAGRASTASRPLELRTDGRITQDPAVLPAAAAVTRRVCARDRPQPVGRAAMSLRSGRSLSRCTATQAHTAGGAE